MAFAIVRNKAKRGTRRVCLHEADSFPIHLRNSASAEISNFEPDGIWHWICARQRAPGLTFLAAVSFVTNMNGQASDGDTTLSNLVQAATLDVRNPVPAVPSIAVTRRFGDEIHHLIERHAKGREVGFGGDSRVNILEINLALGRRFPSH